MVIVLKKRRVVSRIDQAPFCKPQSSRIVIFVKKTLAIVLSGILLVGCGAEDSEKPQSASSTSSESQAAQHNAAGELLSVDQAFYEKSLALFDKGDFNKAGAFLLSALELGNQDALKRLDSLIRTHREYRSLEEHWVPWLEKTAYRGLMIAQLDLAKRHLIGDGVERSVARGYAWYLTAKDSDARLPVWAKEEWVGIDDVLSEEDRREAFRIKEEIASRAKPTSVALDRLSVLLVSAAELPLLQELSGEIPTINTLLVHAKEVRTLPELLVREIPVRNLILTDTSVETLPEGIGKMKSLRSLVVYNAPLRRLPTALKELTDLRELSVNGTDIDEIPTEIRSLLKLRRLDLSRNKISLLPSELWSLPNLSILDVSENNIRKLPVEMTESPALEKLYVRNNPLEIDQEVLMKISEKTEVIAENGRVYKGKFSAQLTEPPSQASVSLLDIGDDEDEEN